MRIAVLWIRTRGIKMTEETERFMVDDAGTLIDKQTCKCYDYMEEILPLLNSQEEKIQELEKENEWLKQSNKNLGKIAYPTQRYFDGDE